MQMLPFSPEAMTLALSIIEKGGVVAHPTETCYGFACDLSNKEAVEKLFAIKKRPISHPVSGLFATVNDVTHYVEWGVKAYEISRQHLPGPLTVIVPIKADAPHQLFPTPLGGATIGVRVSSHPVASQLAVRYGVPLSTTSANIHGQPNPYNASEILSQYAMEDVQPDLVIDGGEQPRLQPSTVIDLTRDDPVIVRQGDVNPL